MSHLNVKEIFSFMSYSRCKIFGDTSVYVFSLWARLNKDVRHSLLSILDCFEVCILLMKIIKFSGRELWRRAWALETIPGEGNLDQVENAAQVLSGNNSTVYNKHIILPCVMYESKCIEAIELYPLPSSALSFCPVNNRKIFRSAGAFVSVLHTWSRNWYIWYRNFLYKIKTFPP